MNKTRDFFKGFFITVSIVFCVLFALTGIAKAYENTVYIAFGAEKSAIAFTDSGLRILDFEIDLF